jgi:hypothetical protein
MKSLRNVLVAALLAGGCYDTARVRPEELPKLNDTYTNNHAITTYQGGKMGLGSVTDESVRHLVAADGTVVEVKGEASVRLETAQGSFDFEHPIIANVTDDQVLQIAAGNRAQTAIPLADVRAAMVRSYDREKTLVLGCGIIAAAAVIGTLVALAASHH